MNVQPRAKQGRLGEGSKPHSGTARRPLGAVCCAPGVNRRLGRLPDCLAGMGVGVALPPGAGSWGRPWESGFFSGLVGFPRRQE